MSAIKIKNNLIKKRIIISIDDKLYYAKYGETIIYETSKDNINLKISVDKKDRISFKWLSVLLTEAVSSDAKSVLFFDCSCDVICRGNDLDITVSENNYRQNDSLMLSSVLLISSDDCIKNLHYTFSKDKGSPKTKHTVLQLLFLSGLPILTAGLIYLFFSFKIEIFIACIVLFLIGTIPSVKAIKGFNKTFDNGNVLLSSEIENRSDYDRIEYVANEMITDKELKGPVKFIAKIIKKLLD